MVEAIRNLSLSSVSPRAHVAMFAAALFLIACALTTAIDPRALNTTQIINKEVLHKLSQTLKSNTTIDQKHLALLNKTIQNLGVDQNIVDKFTSLVTSSEKDFAKTEGDRGYDAYGDEIGNNEGNVRHIEESPDYASSVVLASDLLSLTSAVASVQEKVCREQGYKFLDGLIMNKRWALKMFDASAKSPQGLLFGSSYHLGNFDECVAIVDPGDNGVTIEGQYCLATIKWRQKHEMKKLRTGRGETLRWAVCVPSACHANSVASFVSSVLAHTVSNTTGVVVTDKDCYTRRPISITKLDVAYLSIILLFVTVLFFSTMFEIYVIYWGSKKGSNTQSLIISFSIINNMKKILSTKQHNTLGLECVTGIKTLAMIFIIAGHACMFIASGPVMDADAWDRLVRAPANAFMLNNTLLVDTFLMLSAFLFSRLLLVELDKRGGKLNVIPILVFRYIRVTPAYLVVILFYMTWLPKIGEGPLWQDRLQLEQQRCMDSWWTNILYINNYVNTDKMCMFQSWYLSVDTQLFFIAPFFIYSLWRWRKFGVGLITVTIIISIIVPSVITYRDSLDPTLLFYAKEFTDIISNYYFNEAYIKTHMKMIIYFAGILTGYILHRIQKENYQFSFLIKSIAWAMSVIIGTITTFSVTIFYQEWYQYSELEAAAYISLHKLAWGMVNGWLIIACATGNGGVLGRLLTWKFLAPFSRLTFCAYLVNGIVELYYVGELRHPLHITFFTVMATGISHIVLTFLLALFLCLTFESPLHGIEKILLRMFADMKGGGQPMDEGGSRPATVAKIGGGLKFLENQTARPVLSDNAREIDSDVADSSKNTSQSKLDS